MKTLKLFVAIIAIVFAFSLTACTVEYRQRHGYAPREHHDRDDHRDHDDRH